MAKVRPYQSGDEVVIVCDRGWRPASGHHHATLVVAQPQHGQGCWLVRYDDVHNIETAFQHGGKLDIVNERRFTLETPASDEQAA